MSILVKNLYKSYGNLEAVSDISFKVDKGEVVGFLGPNGAGKSTVMRILAGYMPPSSGEVEINDLDVVENRLEVGQVIGYLPEHNPLYTDMYVREYLYFIAGLFHITDKKERVDELVLRTGLTDHQFKKIKTLSKGYRQRVGLAQALMNDPDVLILDEPISGLDPNQLVEIRSLIKELGAAKAVLFSSHILQEIEAVCDRLIIINEGEIVADGPVSELKQSLSGDQILVVRAYDALNPDVFRQINGVNDVRVNSQTELQILHTAGVDINKDVFAMLIARGISVKEVFNKETSVEEVFQLITRGA